MIISKTGSTFFRTSTETSRTLLFEGGGLTVNPGAGEVSFSGVTGERVFPRLKTSQEWRNDSANPLIVGSFMDVRNTPVLRVSGSGDIRIGGRLGTVDFPLESLVKSGTGTLTLGGSVFATGGSVVEGGTLLLNGRHAGQVTVGPGGTLGGGGTVGTTSVSGNLRPGSSGTGLLSFEDSLGLSSSAVTTMEISGVTARGSSYGGVNVAREDGLTLGGALRLSFTKVAELGSYNLFDFTGTPGGGFGSVTLAGFHSGSLSKDGAGLWSRVAGGFTFTFSEVSGDLNVYPKPLIYNFNIGLQGWAQATAANTNVGPRNFALSPPSFPGDTQGGAGAVGQNIQGGTQDSPHPTLRLRSPEFKLTGAGKLTAWLKGGTGSGTLAGTAVAALPSSSSNPGFQGIALRNASSGQYVLAAVKTSFGDTWEQVSLSATQLAALDQNANYTLDLVDAGHGSWGWVAMDSVTIPGQLAGLIAAAVPAYEDWAASKGLAGAATAFDADPDGDGIANGLEFVLGGEPNPTHADSNSLHLLPTAQAGTNGLVFSFQCKKEAAYLNPVVEFSDDLSAPWTTALHGTNATIITSDAGAFETITVTIPQNGSPRRFARLKVSQPSP